MSPFPIPPPTFEGTRNPAPPSRLLCRLSAPTKRWVTKAPQKGNKIVKIKGRKEKKKWLNDDDDDDAWPLLDPFA
jgi:hypothetical protein